MARIPILGPGDKVQEQHLPDRLSPDQLAASIAERVALGNALPALELVPFTDYGNSWAQGGVSSTAGAGYWSRIASRNRTKAQNNQAVSGTQSDEILAKIIATWTPNTQGLVGLGDIVLNDLRHWGTDTDRSTTRECFRSMLARLNSWSVQDATSASLVYGPGWTNGTSDGTAGRYVDVAWTGPIVSIRVGCVTGAGATVTVKDAGTGATVATFATGGFKAAFEGVIRLTGYSAGSHTVRVSVDAAATVSGAIVPMPAPPLIVWLKAGDTVEGGATQRARIALYLSECAGILGTFPNVLPVDLNGQGWDINTMLATDGLHPNDRGNAFIADRIQATLLNQGFSQGLNSMTGTDAGTYAPPNPSYAGPGATAPSAPTGVAAATGNQLNVTWTRAADGGSTLTGQPIHVSTDGGSTWNTVATAGPSVSSYTVTSGVTSGTSYTVRVGATNSIGTTYSSASGSVTAGDAPTIWAADDFNRANGAAGSTPTGNYAWASRSGTLAISNNQLVNTVSTANDDEAYIDDGHADGTVQATISSFAVASNGLLVRSSSGTDGIVFWCQASSKAYTVSRRTGANAYSALQAVAGVTGAVGDVLKVVMSGTSVKCYINGALVATITDSTTNTKTRHGLWRSNTIGAQPLPDSFSHSSVIS